MNELELLQRLGAATPPPSAEVVRHARDRLAAETSAPTRARPFRSFGARALLAAAVVVGLAVAAVVVVDRAVDERIDRVGTVPMTPGNLVEGPAIGQGPVNILLVGTDAPAPGAGGERADVVVLLRVTRSAVHTLWIPREVVLGSPADGTAPATIGLTRLAGPDALVDGLSAHLGVEVNHYVEMDMEGFAELVDAVGGVELRVTESVRDEYSGLDLAAGCTRVDGAAALALARSRTPLVLRDGAVVPIADSSPGLFRLGTQQVLLRALARAVGDAIDDDPARALDLVDRLTGHLSLDQSFDRGEVRALARVLLRRSSTASVAMLPVQLNQDLTAFSVAPGVDVDAMLRGKKIDPPTDVPPPAAPLVQDPGARGC